MKIGSISEELTSEKRISLTPELSKKYLDLGVEIFINKNYGIHLGFHDTDYKKKGVQILNKLMKLLVIVILYCKLICQKLIILKKLKRILH